MNWEIELLQEPYGGVSEGPVWDGSTLLYTQIQACRIMQFDPQIGSISVYRTNTHYANGLTLDARNRVYACEGGTRRVVRYEADGGTTVLADQFEGKRLNVPNDLVIDRQERVWFTDPFYEGAAGPFSYDRVHQELQHESVYRLDPQSDSSWSIDRVTFDTTRPNGVLLSLDQRTLFVAQSGRRSDEKRELRAYPIEAGGQLGSPTVLHDFGEHRGVDGMRLDSEGNIVATAGFELGGPGPSIYVFATTGEVLERYPVPANRPTNCVFGDDDLGTLYITTTEGHLMRARPGRRGNRLTENA